LPKAFTRTPGNRAAMELPSLLNGQPSAWQTWVIPTAGLVATLLTLCAGRIVLARQRGKRAAAAEGPAHDPFEQGSLSERRGSARRKGSPIEVLLADDKATPEPLPGWVIDRSVGGLCLLLHDEIAPGTALRLKPRKAPPATPWTPVEVCSCTKERDGYRVGCRFVRTPPWAVLLLFG
jgi:hypothetical protein